MKRQRHREILEIISQESVETQEDLARRLRERGFEVTQATVSRDIKELRLLKVLTDEGSYRYAVAEKAEQGLTERLAPHLYGNGAACGRGGKPDCHQDAARQRACGGGNGRHHALARNRRHPGGRQHDSGHRARRTDCARAGRALQRDDEIVLLQLAIRSIALIDRLEIAFGPGLNVLTGETGAGKSIVVGSLDFVLGGRADKDRHRRRRAQRAGGSAL